jgi:hypothetical protein
VRSLFTAPNINYTVSVMVDKKELLDHAIDQANSTMRRVRKLSPSRKIILGFREAMTSSIKSWTSRNTGAFGLGDWDHHDTAPRLR